MPLSAAISPAVLAVVVGHLVPHFLTGAQDDPQAARATASNMLASYNVGSEAELAVAAEIISLSFQALKALGQAADPDLPLNKVLRLRGGAVSLSRESHKARRRLDQLQRIRLTALPSALPAETRTMAEPAPLAKPAGDPAPSPAHLSTRPIEPPPFQHASFQHVPSRDTSVQDTTARPPRLWTNAERQRLAAQRMTENLKRNQAEHARREAAGSSAVQPGPASQPAA